MSGVPKPSDDKTLRLIRDDLSTGGHTLGEDVRELSDEEFLGLLAIINHWHFQLVREVSRRAALATKP